MEIYSLKRHRIAYPSKVSEAEVQAHLWLALKEQNLDVRLSVYGNGGNGKRALLDVVVFDGGSVKCIIECKTWTKNYAKSAFYHRNNMKQIERYQQYFGKPLFVCGRIEDVPAIVRKVLSVM